MWPVSLSCFPICGRLIVNNPFLTVILVMIIIGAVSTFWPVLLPMYISAGVLICIPVLAFFLLMRIVPAVSTFWPVVLPIYISTGFPICDPFLAVLLVMILFPAIVTPFFLLFIILSRVCAVVSSVVVTSHVAVCERCC